MPKFKQMINVFSSNLIDTSAMNSTRKPPKHIINQMCPQVAGGRQPVNKTDMKFYSHLITKFNDCGELECELIIWLKNKGCT